MSANDQSDVQKKRKKKKKKAAVKGVGTVLDIADKVIRITNNLGS